jgi:hypothetical protein
LNIHQNNRIYQSKDSSKPIDYSYYSYNKNNKNQEELNMNMLTFKEEQTKSNNSQLKNDIKSKMKEIVLKNNEIENMSTLLSLEKANSIKKDNEINMLKEKYKNYKNANHKNQSKLKALNDYVNNNKDKICAHDEILEK